MGALRIAGEQLTHDSELLSLDQLASEFHVHQRTLFDADRAGRLAGDRFGVLCRATEARKDGRSVGSATYAISDDGKTLTLTIGGTDAAGKTFDQVIVFDRPS
jgi:hypothetical protein